MIVLVLVLVLTAEIEEADVVIEAGMVIEGVVEVIEDTMLEDCVLVVETWAVDLVVDDSLPPPPLPPLPPYTP